ncbi:MAG: type II toxin-antitoxin system VapB family antitoxin [Acidimicrobiia bacterium]
MPRVRVSTTVDEELLAQARNAHGSATDAALIDAALSALLDRYRQSRIDAEYEKYDKDPLDAPDDWGDLSSWRERAGSS